MPEYIKDFNKWNEIKKQLNSKATPLDFFFREQEIWWCALGVNVGSEQDGKNEDFERPVLIIRRLSKDLLLIAPLTTNLSLDKYKIPVVCAETESMILLIQSKIISSKRLLRRIGIIKRSVFLSVIIDLTKLIIVGNNNT